MEKLTFPSADSMKEKPKVVESHIKLAVSKVS